jgi:hypothetical protein
MLGASSLPCTESKAQEVRGGRRTALEFIEVQHLQAMGRAWIVRVGRSDRPHGRTQGQAANAAHAVDAYFHGADPYYSTIVELLGRIMSVL